MYSPKNLMHDAHCDNLLYWAQQKIQRLKYDFFVLERQYEKHLLRHDEIEAQYERLLDQIKVADELMQRAPDELIKKYESSHKKRLEKKCGTLLLRQDKSCNEKQVLLQFQMQCLNKEMEEIKKFIGDLNDRKKVLDKM